MKKTLLALLVIAAFSSCNKNDDIITGEQQLEVDLKSTSASIATTEAQVDDVSEAVEYEVNLFIEIGESTNGTTAELADASLKSAEAEGRNLYKERYIWGKCPDITIEKGEDGWPRTTTLNYGEETELSNGRIISGIVEMVQTASRKVNGATCTVTFTDFSIDSIGIAGTRVKTFSPDEMAVNVIGDLTYTLPEGTTITRNSERTKTWVEGMDTPYNHYDDVFEITGFVNCSDSDDNVYRRDITSALIKKGACRFIVAGEVSLSKNDVEFATINYGDGECDRIATMTTEEGSEDFKIGKRVREYRKDKQNAEE